VLFRALPHGEGFPPAEPYRSIPSPSRSRRGRLRRLVLGFGLLGLAAAPRVGLHRRARPLRADPRARRSDLEIQRGNFSISAGAHA
jgi:hypothetical protein